MRLCMFHPLEHPMERGWVGRVEGDRVIHLAAQTLQTFFSGGGAAREHAVYPLDGVRLLAPVLHPPAVRVFDTQTSFEFANPAAILGPDAEIDRHRSASSDRLQSLTLLARLAAVVGAEGALAGLTLCADWRAPGVTPPKDRDFALGLGPVVVTLDELDLRPAEASVRVDGADRLSGHFPDFDWDAARNLAAEGTALFPGDVLVGPSAGSVDGLGEGDIVVLEHPEVGPLRQTVGSGA